MRKKLKQIGDEERYLFEGTFVRTGFKTYKNSVSPTLLIKDLKIVKENGKTDFLSDHLWLNYSKCFLELGKLEVGDVIQFFARVAPYRKGYKKTEIDFKLSYPTKAKLKNKKDNIEKIPTDKYALIGMILEDNKKFYLDNFRSTPDDDFYLAQWHSWQRRNK